MIMTSCRYAAPEHGAAQPATAMQGVDIHALDLSSPIPTASSPAIATAGSRICPQAPCMQANDWPTTPTRG
jgi:hypothetical protein